MENLGRMDVIVMRAEGMSIGGVVNRGGPKEMGGETDGGLIYLKKVRAHVEQ